MPVVGVALCLLLSACASPRIDGVAASSLDAAFGIEQAMPGATRGACPVLAGDYAARGAVLAARGEWALADADLAALLARQGWDVPAATQAAASAQDAAGLRLDDADAARPIRLQWLSEAGDVIGAPVLLQVPISAAGPALRSVACVDRRLVLRSVQQWRIAGETDVRDTWIVMVRRASAGLDVVVDRRRVSRGGLLFAITTRDRASSRFLFASRDGSQLPGP